MFFTTQAKKYVFFCRGPNSSLVTKVPLWYIYLSRSDSSVFLARNRAEAKSGSGPTPEAGV